MNIKIGTRGSKLALVQAALAEAALLQAAPELRTETVILTTKGDRILDRPLEQIGGKGVFIGEIEAALCAGEIDLAVHSAKDLPPEPAEGTVIAAVLPRGDARDTLVVRRGMAEKMQQNPGGSYRIGTGSVRRISGVKQYYPNAEFAGLRGNIDTRLEKLAQGEYDAVVLAAAGLERLHLMHDRRFVFVPFPTDRVVPAACQGIIALQTRQEFLPELMQAVCHTETMQCYETERAVLRLLNAGCEAPVGAYAEVSGGSMRLTVTNGHRRIRSGAVPVSDRFALAERLVNLL